MAVATTAVSGGRWTRVHALGRGASGAEVWLAADAATGALCAVKSAPAASAAAEQLRREARVMSALRSPHVLPCLGFKEEDASGECRLFLEYAPGGTLADAAARSSRDGGRRLGERAVRAYAADVARALAYIHGESLVHGDVKPRNVVIGADGRAKLADFGCAHPVSRRSTVIGGTPAFMAPEVARGEAQGPPADVWALGCTVLELATGRTPWGDNITPLAAVHRVGYTDATPEVPAWLSADARDFLARCFARDPRDRPAAAELLEQPFLKGSSEVEAEEMQQVPAKCWVSPKSALDVALWESDADEDDEDDDHADMAAESPAQRIKALAGPCSALPDWDDCDDEGWIEVLNEQQCEASSNLLLPAATKVAAEEEVASDEGELFVVLVSEKITEAEAELISDANANSAVINLCFVDVGSAAEQQQEVCFCCNVPTVVVFPVDTGCNSNRIEMSKSLFRPKCLLVLLLPPVPLVLQNDNKLLPAKTKSRTPGTQVSCDDSRRKLRSRRD